MSKGDLAEKLRSRYVRLVVEVFVNNWKPGVKAFEFERTELERASSKLGIELPKNLGDIVYHYRYRLKAFPAEIAKRADKGMEWIIVGAGKGRYRFRQISAGRIAPTPGRLAIKIPDATPEIIVANALSDEQALLAKVRYNRLIDIFLGITAYSLQNHLRSTAADIGQLEIDEIYVGVDRNGRQFVIPVQAKSGSDALSKVQTLQDLAFSQQSFGNLICRPVSAQFMGDTIALFELADVGDDVKIVEERHYKLVPADEISPEELKAYRRS